jgi:hypothetical protein
MLRADVVTSSCALHPELEYASMGELNRLFMRAIDIVGAIANNMRGDPASQAMSLRQAWLDHWLPYRDLAATAPEIWAAEVMEPAAQLRVCDLVDLTESLAENVYMADVSGKVAVAYGDYIATLAAVRDRVAVHMTPTPSSGRRRVVVAVAGLAIAGAIIGGIALARR